MEEKKMISCFYFKYTGKCPLKSLCPDILGHKRCLAFLYGECLRENCAFYHDVKNKAILTKEDFCQLFKTTGSCNLNETCKFSFFHKNCLHFQKGNCVKGDNCPFYHNKQTKAKILKETPEICKHFLTGTCKYGDKCFKLHQKQGISNFHGVTNSPKKEGGKLCQEFVKGACPRGKACPLAHVCRHFLKGFCKLGANCTFPHITVKDKEEPIAKDLESESESHSSFGGETIKDESICCICLDSPSTHATAPCGHLIYCEKCVQTLRFCAMCRSPIKSFIRIYK